MKRSLTSLVLCGLLLCIAWGSGSHKNTEPNTMQADKPNLRKYLVDPEHSSIQFKVKHKGISLVHGHFKNYRGSLSFEGDQLRSMQADIRVNSVDTAHPKRDRHLMDQDFFSGSTFPNITFATTEVHQDVMDIKVQGDLGLRGSTQKILLEGKLGGFVYELDKKTHRVGIHLSGKISRRAFGFSFDKTLDSGAPIVGDEVTIDLYIEASYKEAY